MDPSIQVFMRKESELCLGWENTLRMATYTMDNGGSMQKMVGVYYRIRLLAINTQELGNKTKRMVLADNRLWLLSIKAIMWVIKNKVSEF